MNPGAIKDHGGPAFPCVGYEAPEYGAHIMTVTGGMTLRDYFAAKAMQAGIAGCSTRGESMLYKDMAAFAYGMADAMLKAREA